MSKKHKRKGHKKTESKIYVDTHVEVCNSTERDFNGWKGIVTNIDRESRPVVYVVHLKWNGNSLPADFYQGFHRRKLKIIKIGSGRKKKA